MPVSYSIEVICAGGHWTCGDICTEHLRLLRLAVWPCAVCDEPMYAMAYPNCRAYDPAFAYEVGVLIRDGIRRMYGAEDGHGEDCFYYLALYNENCLLYTSDAADE